MAGTSTPNQDVLREHEDISLRILRYDSMEKHRTHRHSTASITLILGGSLEESSVRANVCADVLSVVIKPANLAHGDCFGPAGASTLQIGLSAEITRDYAPYLNYRWLHGGEISRILLNMLANRDEGARNEDPWASLLDVLAALKDAPAMPSGVASRSQLTDLVSYLDEDCDQGLCVRSAAESMGMHPVSLARAFRRQFGCSITEYIRRARTLRAARLITKGDVSLAGIASDSGFADQAHFTRAFRAETGLPPGRFRQVVRSYA